MEHPFDGKNVSICKIKAPLKNFAHWHFQYKFGRTLFYFNSFLQFVTLTQFSHEAVRILLSINSQILLILQYVYVCLLQTGLQMTVVFCFQHKIDSKNTEVLGFHVNLKDFTCIRSPLENSTFCQRRNSDSSAFNKNNNALLGSIELCFLFCVALSLSDCLFFQTEDLTFRRICKYQEEFDLIFFSFSSARIFFQQPDPDEADDDVI